MQDLNTAPAFELVQSCLADMNRAKQRARAIRKGRRVSSLSSGASLPSNNIQSHVLHQPFWGVDKTIVAAERKDQAGSSSLNINYYPSKSSQDKRSEDLTFGFSPQAPPPSSNTPLRSRGSKSLANAGLQQISQNHNNVTPAQEDDTCREPVEALLKRFANEVARWRQSNRQNPTPDIFALHLKETYIDEELRSMASSKMVLIARKAIALEISKIAKLKANQNTEKTVTGLNGNTKSVDPRMLSQEVSSEDQSKLEHHRWKIDEPSGTNTNRASNGNVPTKFTGLTSSPGNSIQQTIGNFPAGNASMSGLSFDQLLAMCETQQTTLQQMMKNNNTSALPRT